MKKTSSLLIIAIVLLSALVVSFQFNTIDITETKWPKAGAKADGLQLAIQSKKNAYLQGEECHLNVLMKNTNNKDKTLIGQTTQSFYRLVLMNHEGVIIPIYSSLDLVSYRGDSIKTVLRAGEVEQKNWRGSLSTLSLNKENHYIEKPLAPGAYKIALELDWDIEHPNQGNAASLRSNWINITISTPNE